MPLQAGDLVGFAAGGVGEDANFVVSEEVM